MPIVHIERCSEERGHFDKHVKVLSLVLSYLLQQRHVLPVI